MHEKRCTDVDASTAQRVGRATLCLLKIPKVAKLWRFWSEAHNLAGILALIPTVFSWLACRIHSRAELELELIALRHQVAVLRRRRSGHLRRYIDRMVWVWLYRVWPRCLETMVLVSRPP